MKNEIRILSRIPTCYFFTDGKGESDYGGKGLPYEAGAWDGALRQAEIHNQNIIPYTSVLPPEAREVTRRKGLKMLTWGCVLEVIVAKMNGRLGDRITAGLLIIEVHDPKGKYKGGFAVEYAGNGNTKDAKDVLLHDITEMLQRRQLGCPNRNPKELTQKTVFNTTRGYKIKVKHLKVSSMVVKKKYGTVLSAMAFTEFALPLAPKRNVKS
jgi:arginine decarboxylase